MFSGIGRRGLPLLAAALAVVLVVGCSGSPLIRSPRGSDDAEAAKFEPIHDIPIPAGSTLDSNRSLILSTENRWTGRVVLNSESSMAKVYTYYGKQMRSLGWQPIASIMGDTSVLTFVQGNRTATVQISSATLGGSVVTVTMAPRQPSQITGVDPPKRDTSIQADRLPDRR